MADVLLVGDDEAIGGAVRAALAQALHRVRWCPDGAAAVAAHESSDAIGPVMLDLGLSAAFRCRKARYLPGSVARSRDGGQRR